ncbi:hypothetical protein B0A55_04655 [Friedmanniomyces simplex]|uniref:Uncharacterized protein n=1 Tax=Friedmanniomyces simplex TaxID=329884 RepID=A0A4U0XH00_9PEZI|nr:hypothetical protein B0A55_04655 [Friedmanniomyces simplex]
MSEIVKPRHELEEELRLARLEIEALEAAVLELERAYQLSAERLGAKILDFERTYQRLSRQEESSDAADNWGTAGAPSLHAVGNWDDDRLNRNATVEGNVHTNAWAVGEPAESEDAPPGAPEPQWEGRLCPDCQRRIRRELDPSDKMLSSRSRLDDEDFYSKCRTCGSPSRWTNPPYEVQVRLLQSAHRIAQETLWHAIRRHFPKWHNRHYPEHPLEINFGREDLRVVFDSLRVYAGRTSNRREFWEGAMQKAVDTVPLRNAMSHMKRLPPAQIDLLMKPVQELAIALDDEPRTNELRALRDELQGILRNLLAEIEDLETQATLPDSSPWAIHHQYTFRWACSTRRISAEVEDGTYLEIPASVRRAAEHWQQRSDGIGELDAACGESLEGANAPVSPIAPPVIDPSAAAHLLPGFQAWTDNPQAENSEAMSQPRRRLDDEAHSDLGTAGPFEEDGSTDGDAGVTTEPDLPAVPEPVDTGVPVEEGGDTEDSDETDATQPAESTASP